MSSLIMRAAAGCHRGAGLLHRVAGTVSRRHHRTFANNAAAAANDTAADGDDDDTAAASVSSSSAVAFDEPTFEVHRVPANAVHIRPGVESFRRYTDNDNHERNPGIPLDMSWVHNVKVNKSAAHRRAGEIAARRGVKKAHQAAWLLNAIRLTDLTTLSGDDTRGKVQRLCAKARHPVRADILEALGVTEPITTGAVCVYPAQVSSAVEFLEGSGIPVASVATGFPSGQIKHEHKLEEIEQCVADGAKEIDIVINRDAALSGDWDRVYVKTVVPVVAVCWHAGVCVCVCVW